MPVDFVVDDVPGLRFNLKSDPEAGWNKIERHDGAIWISYLNTNPNKPPLRFTLPNGKSVGIYVLSQDAAEHSWKIKYGRETRLFWTENLQVFINGNIAVLQRLDVNLFNAGLIPNDARLVPLDRTIRLRPLPGGGYLTPLPDRESTATELTATQTKPADPPAPLPADFKPSSRPRVVAAAPTGADWSRAAIYSSPLPKSAFAAAPTAPPTEQYFLRITYTGDVARLSVPIDGKEYLLDDNFADGRPWLVGLTRFDPQLTQASNESGAKVALSIYPLRANPPIFFEPGYQPRPDYPPATLDDVALITQYTLKLKLVPAPPIKP
jgi:hypothetical protein